VLFTKRLLDIDEVDPAHVCALASEESYEGEHKVSLLQLSYASIGGCPVCRLNFQAILICIPELRHILQDPLSLDSVSISHESHLKEDDDKTDARYVVHSESSINLITGDGYRIFTLEGESEPHRSGYSCSYDWN
jgi:hypothetical protein